MKLMVTTNKKPVIDTHNTKRKKSKHTLKIVIKSQRKRAKEERN